MGARKWDTATLYRMGDMRAEGKTLREVGAAFGITGSRVRQLLDRASRIHHAEWRRANGWTTDGAGGRWVDPPNWVELQRRYVAPVWSIYAGWND